MRVHIRSTLTPPPLSASVSQQPQVARQSKSGPCPVEAGVPTSRLQSGCQRYGHRLLGFRALLATGQAGHKVRLMLRDFYT